MSLKVVVIVVLVLVGTLCKKVVNFILRTRWRIYKTLKLVLERAFKNASHSVSACYHEL